MPTLQAALLEKSRSPIPTGIVGALAQGIIAMSGLGVGPALL
ncbi:MULTISPECIES: hypothetical protein [unclassified Bradyrhizobium]|nr:MULTISPECIES: hypothetical protein [unclassified Bradyrhizobium]